MPCIEDVSVKIEHYRCFMWYTWFKCLQHKHSTIFGIPQQTGPLPNPMVGTELPFVPSKPVNPCWDHAGMACARAGECPLLTVLPLRMGLVPPSVSPRSCLGSLWKMQDLQQSTLPANGLNTNLHSQFPEKIGLPRLISAFQFYGNAQSLNCFMNIISHLQLSILLRKKSMAFISTSQVITWMTQLHSQSIMEQDQHSQHLDMKPCTLLLLHPMVCTVLFYIEC